MQHLQKQGVGEIISGSPRRGYCIHALHSTGAAMSRHLRQILLILAAALLARTSAHAQEGERPGKPVGKVSVAGDLILLEMDEGALGKQNLFDLGRRTLRFTPQAGGYRVENPSLQWDADVGSQISAPQVTLPGFSF